MVQVLAVLTMVGREMGAQRTSKVTTLTCVSVMCGVIVFA